MTVRRVTVRATGCLLAALLASFTLASEGQEIIPHGQTEPPGPPLSPAEAIRKMTVPEGFHVELVASEPNLVNPVAMTFDERGRIWVTESLEYPRSSAGPGKDRIKVLEDTDGDGKADKFTIFAEGFNIPSGIAVGHGGVWVANSPDILFLQDTDGDGKADKREVIVTGFGRDDTHELPNSLTWGPDGWLYGWNGVFNHSHVNYRGKDYRFTCAIFRIHPRTREFELFCEGTSNPWGIAIDPNGSFFASACVIDHLWHLIETGYYHRQGGPYPPFTWKIDSIVDHKHQKAAYCGIHYFDSEAYPASYRDRLYMGNIHGNCINVDTLKRNGSTYRGEAAADFLTAHDAWFMPVSQKTGPDGCLYILDWYDQYHCYQDARRDPQGIDRLKGRLYRVRYQDAPRRANFDLARESDDQLIHRLGSPNVYDRDIAQRLLVERNHPAARTRLEKLVLDMKAPRKARMHALWVLVSQGDLDPAFHRSLVNHDEAILRAWGVRAAGNMKHVDSALRERIAALAKDESPDVLLQVAIAARKLEGLDAMSALVTVLAHCGDDALVPPIDWQNLHPLLERDSTRFVQLVLEQQPTKRPGIRKILPRALDRMLAAQQPNPDAISRLVAALVESRDDHPEAACEVLDLLAARMQSGELRGERFASLRDRVTDLLVPMLAEETQVGRHAALLCACCKHPAALELVRKRFQASSTPPEERLKALAALTAADQEDVLNLAAKVLRNATEASPDFLGRLIDELGTLDEPQVADVVLDAYPRLSREVQPRAIELLTRRTPWAKALLAAIGKKRISASVLNANQVRKLLAGGNADIIRQVTAEWGTLRTSRNPAREQVVQQMRGYLHQTGGDPRAGRKVFDRLCAQCHKIYGEGQEVGPDLTSNGRNDYDQLISNVFDPSLVIGAAYQATIVATSDGRVLSGLLVENSPTRLVLKAQGGKVETIPRDEVEEFKTSELSLMPEDLEKQLSRQEIADLFSFLALDKPPGDPSARRLSGAPEPKARKEH